jgi:transposase-like protein
MASPPASIRWSEIVERHEASGQSIREFALANGLNQSTLAWWRSKLRRARRQRPPTFVELVVSEPAQTEEAAPLVLDLDAYPARLTIGPKTDLSLLRRVLDALC